MKRKTGGIFVHTVVHQFILRSVACNKLQCGSEVKGNISRQCHNGFMNNGQLPWQLKLVLSEFKLFVSANGSRVLLFRLSI